MVAINIITMITKMNHRVLLTNKAVVASLNSYLKHDQYFYTVQKTRKLPSRNLERH